MKSRRPEPRRREPAATDIARLADEDATEADLDALLAAVAQRYTGRVSQFQPQRGVGQIEAAGGRMLPFALSLLTMGGGAEQARRLRRGARVRYDVTLTAQGPQVSALWLDEGAPRRSASE